METFIKKITPESLAEAKEILLSGGLIGMPTETVYGLAAVGTCAEAVKKIYEVKGRPTDNPLICHVHKNYDIGKLVKIEQPYAREMMDKFMPGPITMVFYSRGVICKEAVCGGDTLAIRMPVHEGCRKLLEYVNEPLVAPSANRSKHVSPVSAMHVYEDLCGQIPLVLDGGRCAGGIESTVVDCTEAVPRILRAGLVTREMIASVAGDCVIAEHKEGDKVKSPGVKYRHYRPVCETALFSESETEKAVALYYEYEKQGKRPYIMCADYVKGFEKMRVLSLGKTPEEIAANLYEKLHEGEKIADVIIAIAMPDEKGVNLGIMNRLKRACG